MIRASAVIAGITDHDVAITPYAELIQREAELIGVSDHVKTERVELVDWVETGKLNLRGGIARTVPLEAPAINRCLDELDEFSGDVRVVIVP